MPDSSSCAVSEIHTRAICDEIGERLRFTLDRTQASPPPRILALLLQLQLAELKAPLAEGVTQASAAA